MHLHCRLDLGLFVRDAFGIGRDKDTIVGIVGTIVELFAVSIFIFHDRFGWASAFGSQKATGL
jgi:hypothetical protein